MSTSPARLAAQAAFLAEMDVLGVCPLVRTRYSLGYDTLRRLQTIAYRPDAAPADARVRAAVLLTPSHEELEEMMARDEADVFAPFAPGEDRAIGPVD